MTTGNMSQIAKSLNVFEAKIWGIAIVPFVATIAGVTNAFARIMWGSISDRIGREYTMAVAFALEGVLIFLMTQISGSPVAFMILMPFVFLAWGEIYALFSAITGDVFGAKNASPYVKDAFHDYVVHSRTEAVNPARQGTKAAALYRLVVPPGGEHVIRLRLSAVISGRAAFAPAYERVFTRRIAEANAFYATMAADETSDDRIS